MKPTKNPPPWKRELNLIIRTYESSVGTEKFISYEDQLGYLYGFTRLLLPKPEYTVDYPGLWKATAIIRELHVYGELQKLGQDSSLHSEWQYNVQHTWLGKKLLQVAEEIAQKESFHQLSVISGVGVRAYYAKLGYKLLGTYMVKKLGKISSLS